MSLSDAGLKDPAMLGAYDYERSARDFYPTPLSAVKGIIHIYEDDFPAMVGWEPFAGDGAIAGPIGALTREMLTTDIFAYDGFTVDGLQDFFAIHRDDEEDVFLHNTAIFEEKLREGLVTEVNRPIRMMDVELIKGQRPDLIISNPPYGKSAERAARHALNLMEAEGGAVMLLCRHEWDAAKSRRDLFDHPAFAGKVTLRHRPRWIVGTTGAPRFAYAWYVWDWTKARTMPHAKPELFYAP